MSPRRFFSILPSALGSGLWALAWTGGAMPRQNTDPGILSAARAQSLEPGAQDPRAPTSAKDIAAALGARTKALDVRPSIALRVQFSLGGARLTPEGRAQLDELARALQSPELDGRRFLLAGHTDSVGRAAFNQRLSLRRAEAAKRYLVDRYGIAPARLEAKGFGSAKLLHPEAPQDERNRRVEVEALD